VSRACRDDKILLVEKATFEARRKIIVRDDGDVHCARLQVGNRVPPGEVWTEFALSWQQLANANRNTGCVEPKRIEQRRQEYRGHAVGRADDKAPRRARGGKRLDAGDHSPDPRENVCNRRMQLLGSVRGNDALWGL
jgi:hypothetical protein